MRDTQPSENYLRQFIEEVQQDTLKQIDSKPMLQYAHDIVHIAVFKSCVFKHLFELPEKVSQQNLFAYLLLLVIAVSHQAILRV